MTASLHPYTWLFWLAAGAAAALLTRNPLYLVIVLLAAGFVFAALRRQGANAPSQPAGWTPVLKLALALWLFTIVFNLLTAHIGDHVLFRLPSSWPLIGGRITLEAAIYGITTGLSFVTLLIVFAAFNLAVGPQTLLRMAPAFAQQAGVALTIAVSFIPQTLIALQEIREAQRLRGMRVRRLADLQPLFVSLLGIGLDRAIQLAESMEARGFGGSVSALSGRERALVGAGTVTGLLILLAGLLVRSFYRWANWPGLGLMLAGGLLLAIVFRRQGRQVQRTRYRRWLWRRADTLTVIVIVAPLLAVLAPTLASSRALFYYPYPPYDLIPAFNPLIGLTLAMLMAPAIAVSR